LRTSAFRVKAHIYARRRRRRFDVGRVLVLNTPPTLSSSVRLCVENMSPFRSRWFASTCVENTGNPCARLRLASK